MIITIMFYLVVKSLFLFLQPFSKIKIIKDLFKKNTKVNIVNIGSIIRGKGIIAEEYDLNKIKSFNHFD